MIPPRPAGGQRRILRRLRDVMASAEEAQTRLDRLVTLIAAELVAEVCSVYVRRAGEVLELFATEGLNPSAVHQTRLRMGEGLVGLVAAQARPLNLPDAPSHPQFSYRPETGEERYHSLLGVPIIRGGRVRGVLVIQNRALRHYSEDEIETLEVIATVLAELIAGGDLIGPEERTTEQGIAVFPTRLTGTRIHGGIATGIAVLHQTRLTIPEMLGDDPLTERERLAQALAAMRDSIETIFARSGLDDSGEHGDVLDAYRSFAEDRGWLRRIEEAIETGLTAEAAVQKVIDDARARLAQSNDPYLRERVYDFEDLGNRMLRHLMGEHATQTVELPDDVVLFAHALGPADLLDYEPERLRGLVLEEGSAGSHVAIVARALDIPVVGMVPNLLSNIDPGDPVILDADNAQVFVRPSDDIQQMVQATLGDRERRRAAYLAMRELPAVTRDGTAISLSINAGLQMDLKALEETDADGVGLYRTEIPFLVRSEFPSVAAQTELYRNILDRACGRPVAFRTLDIGGDKQLPYLRDSADHNPALGWRAIRIGLDRPGVLRQQLRALIRATAGRELSVMFPMVAEVAEFDAAKAILALECDRAERQGDTLPAALNVGAMLEVPGLVWQLDTLLPRVDFVSVGSNDLFQFMFAIDRGNPRVAERYDVLSPGLLALLRMIVEKSARAEVPLSLCGEMAGRPLEAMALIGLGFTRLSMPPAALGPVKAMVRSLDAGALARYLDGLYGLPDHSLRERLRSFSRDHDVVLDAG